MSTGLQTVLEIAGIGTVLLFLALAGLVGLMYAVTSPRLSDKLNLNDDEDANTEADMASRADRAASEAKHEAEAEADRQRRAVALAVFLAIAPVFHMDTRTIIAGVFTLIATGHR